MTIPCHPRGYNPNCSLCKRLQADSTLHAKLSECYCGKCEQCRTVKFVRGADEVVGLGYHRSGWPYSFKHLIEQVSDLSIDVMLDDFVEQTYAYGQSPRTIYNRPWVGIFHHPPAMPEWATDGERPEVYTKLEQFRESLPHLRLAITMSEHLAKWLRRRLPCPVKVIKHPCEEPSPQKKWQPGGEKVLVQIGWYQRNVRLIYQLDVPKWYRVRLLGNAPWQMEWDYRCRGRGREYPGVEELGYVPPEDFDTLLSQAVAVQQVYTASACNGILDCIVRATPVLVNWHPAVVEYLGSRYPLYWQTLDDIPRLLKRVEEGHAYLAALRTPWIDGQAFGWAVREAIQERLS